MPASGTTARTTFLSNGKSPNGKTSIIGNMKMRWYQHREHGGSFMISPKKSAPSVDVLAMTHAPKTSIQTGASSAC
jgi:hypothetical protein